MFRLAYRCSCCVRQRLRACVERHCLVSPNDRTPRLCFRLLDRISEDWVVDRIRVEIAFGDTIDPLLDSSLVNALGELLTVDNPGDERKCEDCCFHSIVNCSNWHADSRSVTWSPCDDLVGVDCRRKSRCVADHIEQVVRLLNQTRLLSG